MKNLISSSSSCQGDSTSENRISDDDWKRAFRLNTLDLNPDLQAAGNQSHWMTQEPHLVRLLERTRDDVVSLNVVLDAAGEPALPTDTNSLLAMLGLLTESKPATVARTLLFAAKVIAGLVSFHHHAAVARTQLRSASSSPMTG